MRHVASVAQRCSANPSATERRGYGTEVLTGRLVREVVEVSPQDNQYKGIPLLTLSGELEFAIRAEIDIALKRLSEAGACIILDLRDVSFMDSSALGLIISLHSRVLERGVGALAVICCHQTAAGRVFQITGLVGVLHLFDDLDDAVVYLDTVCTR